MENEVKKNNKIFIIIISVLAIIISAVLGFILGGKFYDIDKDSNTTVDENNKSINIDLQMVVDAMKSYDRLKISTYNLYKEDTYNISSISNEDLVNTAIKQIGDYNISYCSDNKPNSISISSFDVIKDIIENKTITRSTIESLKKGDNKNEYFTNYMRIVLQNDSVELYGPCDGRALSQPPIQKKIINAEINDKYLYIYEKQAFLDFSMVDSKYKTCKKYSFGLVGSTRTYECNDNDIVEKNLDNLDNLNWDLYNTYKYTFKVENNNYYFQSLELVK